MKYYFLASYLPDIQPDDIKIRVGLSDLLEERFHIAAQDWKEIELVLLGRDIFIIEKLLSGKTVSIEYSLYDLEFWRDQVKSPKEGPEFLLDFLKSARPDAFGPREVDRLYGVYYEYVLASSKGDFLRGYFSFERDLRNILAALRARQLGLDPAEYVTGEGELVEILGSSSAEDFGLGGEYPWIENLLRAEEPHQRQEVIEQILWNYLNEHVGPDPFDFSVILAYLLKVQILHKRLALNQAHGMEKVRRLGGY
ncbi:MAG: DUF2764 family protein [Pseudomonadota bacterium]|nr:DUF2764 domain-containing protein [Pseudomonadota bacterium]